MAEHSKAFVTFNLLLNIALAISIVLLNKTVYTRYGFPNMTLTCIHFICTAIGMFICKMLGIFTVKTLPILKMIPISLTFCGFVVLTNLSLQTNTVGTYQIIKSMTTPGIVMIQAYFYDRAFSTKVKLTIVPIVVGVILNCNYDIKFTLLGCTFAGSGVLVTSLYQVWVSEKQKEFNINSMQLLYYQAPLSAVLLGLVIPFFEPVFGPGGIIGGPWTMDAVMMVSATGVVAFAINMSIFWIIGNTSPLTYNMVGQFKFCLTIIGGFVLFKDPISWLQLLGICITFSGVMTYTYFKLQENAQEKAFKEYARLEKEQAAEKASKGEVSIEMAKEVLMGDDKSES